MFDHIGLKVKDLKAAAAFYEKTLAPLGVGKTSESAESAGFGEPGAEGLWLLNGKASGPVHLAFAAKSRKDVDAFHAAGLKAGAKDNGAPGLRADYSAHYYAAFLLDLDGNNIEAVCLKAR